MRTSDFRVPFQLLVSASLLLAPSLVQAQGGPATAPITVRETVVVTATGRETPASEVGVSVSVIERDAIEQRHALSTVDLLRTLPGVAAIRTGGVGNLTALYVRGGESTYNKVLLDGMPLNEPGGSFNFASLSPENIERVEVLRGAHSALFGSDAMASVIQLFSVRAPAAPFHGYATADGGNYGTAHVSAGAGGRRDALEYSVSGSRLHTDNREPNNAHDATTVFASARRRIGSGLARAIARGEFARSGVPGATAFGRPDMDARFKHQDGSVLGGWNQSVGRRMTQQASYSYVITNQRSTNLITDPPYVPVFGNLRGAFASSDFLYDSQTRVARHHAEYRADFTVGSGQVVTAAFAYDGERGVLTNHRSAAAPQRPERNNTGTSVQYEISASRVSLVSGIRLENNGSFGFYAAPRTAVSWLLRPDGPAGSTRVRASAGLGIKEPLFIQSYSPSPSFLGNPDLEPERSRGFDVGVEQRLASERLAVEVVYFSSHFDDLISLGPSDPVTFNARYENIGETRASGIEFGATARAGALSIEGTYTFLDSKVVKSISSSPIFAPGRRLYRRPRHAGSIQASFTRGLVTASIGGVFIGDRVDTDFNFPSITSNPGHSVWNASAEARLNRQLAAFVTSDNLFAAEYMEPFGYRSLGRTVRAGVRARF